MNIKSKRLKKLILYGSFIVVPAVFLLSLWFASLKMDDTLSVFLIVLLGSIISFLYYLVFERLEKRKEERQKNKKDPFSSKKS